MSLARFARTIAHTRRAQLRERVRRILRNALHDLAPRRSRAELDSAPPPHAAELPLPLFAPRVERVALVGGVPHASFLNVTRALAAPVDWQAQGAPELERMNLHYMEFLEALDDSEFARIALEWVEHNPLEARGSWRIAWNSFVVSLRALVWMQQLAARWHALDVGVRAALQASLARQVRFLESHLELDIGGNHLIKNAKTLVWASQFFDGPEARRWGALGKRVLERELAEQVLQDGVHYERSPSYHLQVFADVLECAHVGDAAFRDALKPVLEKLAQAAVDLSHPDGAPSLFNDGGLHMSYSLAECLDAFESVLGLARPTPREVFVFQDAGYFGARHGNSYFLADCGAIAPDHLPAHGHGDVLAFEWSVGGKRWIVDAGTYEYERGATRARARSSSAHNTVTLDDRDQAEFWAAFRVGRRPRVALERFEPLGHGFVLEGAHDGYAHLPGSPVHRRRFIVGRDSFVIDDSVDGGARQSVTARLLVHPDVSVRPIGRTAAHLHSGCVHVVVEARHPMVVVDAEWFPDFGVRRACKMIQIHYPPAPCRGSLRVQRVAAGAHAPLLAPEVATTVERRAS
ncbi:MAG: alginate lyase family protein [Planctomycetes bacterium]|nr:alginate lyase family protein [Planctomycetota bacterium]